MAGLNLHRGSRSTFSSQSSSSPQIHASSKVMANDNEKTKSYVTWTNEMDRTLSSCLLEEHSKGNKTPNGWKSQTFTAVIQAMKEIHNMDFSKEKIMTRLKTWNKYYRDVSTMLNTSGFAWDWEYNMVKVDNENVWAEYVKTHPSVKHYKNKVIVNWSDLGILCGNDMATGSMVATANEILNDIEEDSVAAESPIGAESSVAGPSTMRKRKATPADVIADAINNMANSMQMTVAAITKPKGTTDSQRIYEALARLPDLTEVELCKILNILSSNVTKYEAFMALPESLRMTWVHLVLYNL